MTGRPATLRAFLAELLEERGGRKAADLERELEATLGAVLEGGPPPRGTPLVRLVAALGGDDQDVQAALLLSRSDEAPSAEALAALRERLDGRARKAERFLEESGQLEAFRAWVARREDG